MQLVTMMIAAGAAGALGSALGATPASAQAGGSGASAGATTTCRDGAGPTSALFCAPMASGRRLTACNRPGMERAACVKQTADRYCRGMNFSASVAYRETSDNHFAELLCFGRSAASVAAAVPPSSQGVATPPPQPAGPSALGNVYSTNDWGDLTVTEWGSTTFRADYTFERGKIDGTRSGMEVTGYWSQGTSDRACSEARGGSYHWGRMSFTFNAALDAFEGQWGYCEETPYATWTGTLTRRGSGAAVTGLQGSSVAIAAAPTPRADTAAAPRAPGVVQRVGETAADEAERQAHDKVRRGVGRLVGGILDPK